MSACKIATSTKHTTTCEHLKQNTVTLTTQSTDHVLFDVEADDAPAADLHLDGLLQDLARQALHGAREGGAEHHRLPVRPHVVDDPHHLRT